MSDDIESLKQEIEQLRENQRELVAKLEQRELFFASLIHEIRTPISAILGMTEILSDTQLVDEQKVLMRDIQASGNILSQLVNDILDLSKLERGYLEIYKEDFELCSMLDNVKNIFKLKLENKALDFNINIDNNTPVIVCGDALRISQVLINLINNAIKFTEKGSIDVNIKTIFKNAKKEIIEFRVVDTGIGLKASHREAIFKSFVQAQSNTAHQYGGTGLGLAISKQLVESIGGEIRVESTYGKGSSFIFTVTSEIKEPPRQERIFHKAEIANYKQKLQERLTYLYEKSILLVEDNSINQMIVESFLKNTNVKVIIANSGEDALHIMESMGQRVDLILMDIKLPGLNGYETTMEIRKNRNYKDIPIISFSAHRKQYAKKYALEAGMNDFLTKPIKIVDFYKVLLRYLEDRRV